MDVEEMMDMLVVPEELVILCSETMVSEYGHDAENTFKGVLDKAEILKEHGRTPVYLCTQDMKTMYITSKEKINKQFH